MPAPYASASINSSNYLKLYQLMEYLQRNIAIDADRLQIIFSPSQGKDIGGFLLLMDQLLLQNINHDFIINLHSHPDTSLRKLLSSFLNICINQILLKYECVYSNRILFDFDDASAQSKNLINVNMLLKRFNLPPHNFSFCQGNMFIVSNKLTDYFKDYDLIKLYDLLNENNTLKKHKNGLIEDAFERFFGYLIDHIGLKTLYLDYQKRYYETDNTISNKISYKNDYDIDKIKNYINQQNIKLMAIYFPQFHEVEENNLLWGKGFTEWTMLKRYKGEIKHPHIDIGYYDMLDYSTRKKQALMAKEHGISAFCYYHYWFKNKKVMYKGIEKILEDGDPNLPFAFCWANEPWTKNWDGSNHEVLIPQDYGKIEDWEKHYRYLAQFFKHPNYIKEDNCPVFYIYRIAHILDNNAAAMLTLWKDMAKQDGFNGLKIIPILCAYKNITSLPSTLIDGFAEHQPGYNIAIPGYKMNIYGHNVDVDRENFYEKILQNKKIGKNYTRGIFYSFDNSSRKKNAQRWKFTNLSYQSFEKFLVGTILKIVEEPNIGNNFILLNSWNEWTEQAMVEPNDQDGYTILKIIKKYFAN